MKLTGTVDVPVIGSVDKRVLLAVGGVSAAFVGWKWWQSRSAAGYDPEAPVDPGMEDPGVLPAVSGAVSPDNSYGLDDGSGPSQDSYGFTGKTNSQWTQYTTTQLVQSDRWSYTDVVAALGAFIANKPLTTDQQSIVQAAIALAGYPPEGSHVIVPGGDTKITVAPTGLTGKSTTSATVTLSWSPVAGARNYRIYRSGASTNVGTTEGSGTSFTVSGLQPHTEYSFQVAASSMSDVPGPKSSAVKVRTLGVKLKAPTGIKVTNIKATTATVNWGAVSGAQYYRIYINGRQRGSADGGLRSYTVSGLSKKTKYKATVAADTTNEVPGPQSAGASFTTKSK